MHIPYGNNTKRSLEMTPKKRDLAIALDKVELDFSETVKSNLPETIKVLSPTQTQSILLVYV